MPERFAAWVNSLRIAVIIPALNEAESISATLAGLAEADSLRIEQTLVADNGSTDRTADAARAAGAQVVSAPQRGYGAACLAAIAALAPTIDVVVFMDADGSDDPADMPRLLEPIARDEADFVLGSRSQGKSQGRCEPGALQPQQEFGNRLATLLLRVLHGARFTDLGPFRAIRRDALERLAMRDKNYGWTIEMQIKAHRAGLRILEIPVSYRRRRAGKSKVAGTLRGTILAGAKILWSVTRY